MRSRSMCSPRHSSYIRHFEDAIKELLGEKWNDWHAFRPRWLTEELVERMPARLFAGGGVKPTRKTKQNMEFKF